MTIVLRKISGGECSIRLFSVQMVDNMILKEEKEGMDGLMDGWEWNVL